MSPSRQLAVVGFLLLTLGEGDPRAQGRLQAGPTLIELAPKTAARLRLRNTGNEPVAAQVRAYLWSQPAGEDHLEPTDDLAISPPIVEVPAGGEQLVRIVSLGSPATGRDRTYRIVVDELPRPEASVGSQVKLRMRYVIPAFVRASDAPPPELACAIEAAGARLACENRGGRAAQLGESRLLSDDGRATVLSEGLFGYVLPGSRRTWPVSPPVATPGARTGLRLETRLNGRSVTLPLTLVP